MSKHRRNGKWDASEETAQWLADLAVQSAVQVYGGRRSHPDDIACSMVNAIEVGVLALEASR